MPRSPISNSPASEEGEIKSPRSPQSGVAEADPASPRPYRSRSIQRSLLQAHGLANYHSRSRSRSPPLDHPDGLHGNRAPATQRPTTGGPSDYAQPNTGRRRDPAAAWRTETETQLQQCSGNWGSVTPQSTSRVSAPERHESGSAAAEQISSPPQLSSPQLPIRERPPQSYRHGLQFSNTARGRLGEQLAAERTTRRFFQRSESEPLHDLPDQIVGRSRRRHSRTPEPEGYRSSRHVGPLASMRIRRTLRQGLHDVGEYRSSQESRPILHPAAARSRHALYGPNASHNARPANQQYNARANNPQNHPPALGLTHERSQPINHRRQQGIDQTVRSSPLHPADNHDHNTGPRLPNPLCPPHITCSSCENCVHHSHCQGVGHCIHPEHDIIHGNCMHSGPCDNTRGWYHTTDWPHVTNMTNSPPTAEINYLPPESMLQVGRGPTLLEILDDRHYRVAAWVYATSLAQAIDDTTDADTVTSDAQPAAQQPPTTDTHELNVARAEELLRESLNIGPQEQADPHHERSPSEVNKAQGEEVMYETNMDQSEYADTLPASSSLVFNIPEGNEGMQQCTTNELQMDDADFVGPNTGHEPPPGTIEHIATVHEEVPASADPAAETEAESGDEKENTS